MLLSHWVNLSSFIVFFGPLGLCWWVRRWCWSWSLKNEFSAVRQPSMTLACWGTLQKLKHALEWMKQCLVEGFAVDGQIWFTDDSSSSPNPTSRISSHSYDAIGLLLTVIFPLQNPKPKIRKKLIQDDLGHWSSGSQSISRNVTWDHTVCSFDPN